MNLVGILKQAQNNRTQRKWAKELGISEAQLSSIYSGKRGIGGKVIRAMLDHPDTQRAMLTFLLRNVA